MSKLKVTNLSCQKGYNRLFENLSFEIHSGEVLKISGPNGSGKSTLFDLITGYPKVDIGKVKFFEKNIFGLTPDKISKLGIGRTFQKLKPFLDQTLLENVMIGALATGINLSQARNKALEMIDLVDLIDKRHHFAKELSTGQRKRLELARAMATEPKLLMMDEVTGGVDQKTVPGLVELIKKLNKLGVTILTIEHNMRVIMDISHKILALDQGKKIVFDKPKNVQLNEKVIDAYLGGVNATTS